MKNELKKTNLLELTKEALVIQEAIIENEGVLDEVLALKHEQNLEQFQAKALATAYAVERIKMEEAFLAEKIKELTARKKALSNGAGRVKDYLKMCLKSAGIKDIKSDMLKISIKPTASWPVITNPDAIPEEFKTGVLTITGPANSVKDLLQAAGGFINKLSLNISEKYSPDKKKIREELTTGGEMPGAEMPLDKPFSITIK